MTQVVEVLSHRWQGTTINLGGSEKRSKGWLAFFRHARWLLLAVVVSVVAGRADGAEPRTAKVAGQFYPQSQTELREVIAAFIKRAPEPVIKKKPRILIVPHAGYPYSGLIAASGYRQLQGYTYDGVVVVGFTHRMQFDGSSVDTRETYQTPLGELPVHHEAVAALQASPGITHLEEAHESAEHSLEVQLPFLQTVLERPRIIPVLMGNVRLEDAEQLAEALAGLSRTGDYLFVFTTDLSHYHPYSEAQVLDERTVNTVLFETPHAVSRLFAQGAVEACGRGPVVASLLLAARLGYLQRELLTYANSGDTAGNPSSVVGYAAIGMFDQPPPSTERLSPEAGAALVQAARESLEQTLAKRTLTSSVTLEQYPELSKAKGVFVTLRTHGGLRGCIGRIETTEPLAKSIPVVALDAALRDARFSPVSAEELADIHVEVSVLTPPVNVSHARAIVPGRDGVILEYQGHHGVFLPQVWEETGWTRLEFLRELASQKAGLPPDTWQQATLSVFQDQAFGEPLPASQTAH